MKRKKTNPGEPADPLDSIRRGVKTRAQGFFFNVFMISMFIMLIIWLIVK